MNDLPPPLPQFQLIAPSGQLMSVTLPLNGAGSPIVVLPAANKIPIKILTQDGRELATLDPSEKAKFEYDHPKWWQFWRSAKWVMTGRERS